MNARTPRRGGLFPKTLADCTRRALQPALEHHHGVDPRLFTHWPDIVGRELAAITTPVSVSIRKGTVDARVLHVQVTGASATELHYHEAQMLEAIAVFFGWRVISHIRAQQGYATPKT